MTASRGGQPRGERGTLQARVYRALKSMSASPRLLAEILGERHASVCHACTYLLERGVLVRRRLKPPLSKCQFYSIARGKQEPRDLRGKNPASHANEGANFASWLRMQQIRLGPTWRYRPKGGHPLDAWAAPNNGRRKVT